RGFSSGSLLVISRLPEHAEHESVGAKRMVSTALWPGSSDAGSGKEETTWNAGFEFVAILAPVRNKRPGPRLETTSGRSSVRPTYCRPKSSAGTDKAMSGTKWAFRMTLMLTWGSSGSLL